MERGIKTRKLSNELSANVLLRSLLGRLFDAFFVLTVSFAFAKLVALFLGVPGSDESVPTIAFSSAS